jgi:hypothetical protein
MLADLIMPAMLSITGIILLKLSREYQFERGNFLNSRKQPGVNNVVHPPERSAPAGSLKLC